MRIMLDERPARYATKIFECTERFQRMVGVPAKSIGQAVSVYLSHATPDLQGGGIGIDPDSITALSVGEAGLGVLIWEVSEDAIASPLRGEAAAGDQQFLRAVKDELGAEFPRLAEAMIAQVRDLQPKGALREGQHRRYINYPDNFVGFTVQPRKRAILVHVRGSTVSKNARSVRVVDDRRPYVRFWVQTDRQLPEALQIIRASWSRG